MHRPPHSEDPTSEEEALEFDGAATDQLDDTYRFRVVAASESARGTGIQFIRYESVRTPNEINVALLTCLAFAVTRPAADTVATMVSALVHWSGTSVFAVSWAAPQRSIRLGEAMGVRPAA